MLLLNLLTALKAWESLFGGNLQLFKCTFYEPGIILGEFPSNKVKFWHVLLH